MTQAYARLTSIVTHCNMVMSAFHSEKYMSEADAVLAHEDAKEAAAEKAATESGGERCVCVVLVPLVQHKQMSVFAQSKGEE